MPRSLDEPHGATTLRLGHWIIILFLLVAAGAGIAWYVMRHTETGTAMTAQLYSLASGDLPPWMRNGHRYTVPKPEPEPPPPPPVMPVAASKVASPPPPPPPQPATKPASKPIKRASMLYLVNEQRAREAPQEAPYTLPAWTYVDAVLEVVLISEIEGMFTVRTTRPVYDETGAHLLIPQGQRIGAKALTADLSFGNERIPGFALSMSVPGGKTIELGEAPIMDAAGTNGLTGIVDNHTWRLVWTSVFIGGLQGGQQVLHTQLGTDGMGPIAAGIARQGNSATQQRLGRAQDTRPTITVAAGEPVKILITKPLSLPALGR